MPDQARNHAFKAAWIAAVALAFACGPGAERGAPKSRSYEGVLQAGLADDYCMMHVPQGRIEIMGGLTARVESSDPSAMRFSPRELGQFQKMEEQGLLSLREIPQAPHERFGRMGARLFTAEPTEKLLAFRSEDRSNSRYVAVPLCTMEVEEIVGDDPIETEQTGTGDQFRLVLGLAKTSPTDAARALAMEGSPPEPHKVKFRAVVQYNPFDKSFRHVVGDLGEPSATEWSSDYVPGFIKRGKVSSEVNARRRAYRPEPASEGGEESK